MSPKKRSLWLGVFTTVAALIIVCAVAISTNFGASAAQPARYD